MLNTLKTSLFTTLILLIALSHTAGARDGNLPKSILSCTDGFMTPRTSVMISQFPGESEIKARINKGIRPLSVGIPVSKLPTLEDFKNNQPIEGAKIRNSITLVEFTLTPNPSNQSYCDGFTTGLGYSLKYFSHETSGSPVSEEDVLQCCTFPADSGL